MRKFTDLKIKNNQHQISTKSAPDLKSVNIHVDRASVYRGSL